MTVYSLYIYDRHCTCIYYHDWSRTKRPKPASKDGLLPAVSRAVSYQPPTADGAPPPMSTFSSPRNTLVSSSGVVVALNEEPEPTNLKPPPSSSGSQNQAPPAQPGSALAFDEEVKLVYGVILSLRTMMKKLSKRDENFTSYRTSSYKLHLYETPTLYKFVLLTDPKAEGPTVRFALRQMYAGPFLEYVVRNPLVKMDSRERGVDNEYFRASVDRLVRGQAFFN
ncbi:TRAPP complex subunit bet5 [Fomitiporia mediterranea MF3/22]|uniref:TRAPP complex subunit bet5 n=1 Tax=Fomitiporia mediterranea (strain MF3/22) TaxID=694068 RepID=UPI000440871B|nr:TRAPP complex subunit bet5 [Fomitiporia mediterranea MF3/22]EJD02714.1 TRAPP complex subunit bet5 [Fomitiporia mediterranea MF3/22]